MSATNSSCTIVYKEAAHTYQKGTSIPRSQLHWCELDLEIDCRANNCFHPSYDAHNFRPVEERDYQISYADEGENHTMEGVGGQGTVTVKEDIHDNPSETTYRDWTFFSKHGWKEADKVSKDPGEKSQAGDSVGTLEGGE